MILVVNSNREPVGFLTSDNINPQHGRVELVLDPPEVKALDINGPYVRTGAVADRVEFKVLATENPRDAGDRRCWIWKTDAENCDLIRLGKDFKFLNETDFVLS